MFSVVCEDYVYLPLVSLVWQWPVFSRSYVCFLVYVPFKPRRRSFVGAPFCWLVAKGPLYFNWVYAYIGTFLHELTINNTSIYSRVCPGRYGGPDGTVPQEGTVAG